MRSAMGKKGSSLDPQEFTYAQNACVFIHFDPDPELIRTALIPSLISSNV